MSVITVPTANPAIIVIAIEQYIGSTTKGSIPTIVVSDAISTGRTLDTDASTTAL